MASSYVALALLVFTLVSVRCVYSASVSVRETYIVRVDGLTWPLAASSDPSLRQSTARKQSFLAAAVARHDNFLERVDSLPTAKLYSYTHSTNGFSAVLSNKQASALRGMSGVISVELDKKRTFQTTYSPSFLGLNDPKNSVSSGLYKATNGSGLVVGMIDSGVWPENLSFQDKGYPLPPRKFLGKCTGSGIKCNRKIVGASYYLKGYERKHSLPDFEHRSARDAMGHGTHTASTAAGSKVFNASIGTVNMGTAQGIAYGAHISVYKVCWLTWDGSDTCYDSDILAAINQAIIDKVDVLSISLGGDLLIQPFDSGIDEGTFNAAIAGIPSAVAAGNNGLDFGSVENIAPWYLSVGACTLPRSGVSSKDMTYSSETSKSNKFVYLGDSSVYIGTAATSGTVPHGATSPKVPLIYARNAALTGVDPDTAKLCFGESLNSSVVQGKILICDRGDGSRIEKGYNALKAGAVGMILIDVDDYSFPQQDYHVLPAINVDYASGLKVVEYATETLNPTAAISEMYIYFGNDSVSLADFSARGPNPQRDIFKPDIVAPGVDIFASYVPYNIDYIRLGGLPSRIAQFNIISGTSMATPHVAGALLLLKSLKPKWSPGALQSALSTTAKRFSAEEALLQNTGHGLMRPNFATDPGLVYDSGIDDYALHLCSYYTRDFVKKRTKISCPRNFQQFDYNSPSLMMSGIKGDGFTTTRRVTNVGPANSVYRVTISQPSGATVKISPKILNFTAKNQVLPFTISVVGTAVTDWETEGGYFTGSWSWNSLDMKYQVQSPILVEVIGLPKLHPPPPRRFPPPQKSSSPKLLTSPPPYFANQPPNIFLPKAKSPLPRMRHPPPKPPPTKKSSPPPFKKSFRPPPPKTQTASSWIKP